jgi:hypothetical protein
MLITNTQGRSFRFIVPSNLLRGRAALPPKETGPNPGGSATALIAAVRSVGGAEPWAAPSAPWEVPGNDKPDGLDRLAGQIARIGAPHFLLGHAFAG